MRFLLALVPVAITIILIGCTPSSELVPAGEAPQSPRIIDLMDGYWSFTASSGEAPETTVAIFRRKVLEQDSTWAAEFLGFFEEMSPEQQFQQIEMMRAEDTGIQDYYAHFLATVTETVRDVATYLDDDVFDIPAYLSVSLLTTNGQVRHIDETPTIMFGLDGMAWADRTFLGEEVERDVRPVITHEYFHAWHWTTNPSIGEAAKGFLPPAMDAPVWLNFWSEGLALCFSRLVYPDLSVPRILSNEDLWEDVIEALPYISAALASDLDSEEPDVISGWFFLSSLEGERPDRAAYALGLMVAHDIVGRYGLRGAATLAGEELRDEIGGVLARMSRGEVRVSQSSVCVPT